mgnify:FL=1
MENIEIPEHEIEGLLQTLKELGIKGIMEWSDVLVLNHLQERGFISSERDKVIKTLKEQTNMSYGEIMELLYRYDKWREVLPSYSLRLNQIMDSINLQWGPNVVIPFRYIGKGPNKKLIGMVREGGKYSIYDNTGKHPMLVGNVNEDYSIHWNDYVKLTTPQTKYLVDKVKELKGRIV